MRIALLHYSAPPVIGGVERIVAEHARLFAAHGHEVTIFCGEGEQSAIGEKARLRVFPELRADGAGANTLRALEEVMRELATSQIVFLHNVLTMPFHPALVKILWMSVEVLAETRFIAWVHDVAAANPDYAAWPMDELLRKAHSRIEYVAVSELRARQFCELTGAATCSVIPNGFDPFELLPLTPEVRSLAEGTRALERDIVLLHPTRLLRRKNVELSLAVTAELRADGVDALLLVTAPGDPHNPQTAEYMESLRELRDSTPDLHQNAIFVADLFTPTLADVAALYQIADALFFPSRQEGFGLPMLEAAVHRLPIFASDLEPLRSIVPPGGATFFSPDASPREIAGEVRRQIEASQAIQNRKAALRSFGWPSIYQKYLAPLLRQRETPSLP